MTLRPDRLPAGLRLGVYGLAVAVLLYLTLAPSAGLPPATLWDKAEHGLAWLVLAGMGLAFWPRRPGRIAAFALGLGALVEALQAVLPLGRRAEAADLVADALGVGFALLLWWFAGLRRRRPGLPASRGRARAG